MRYVREGKTYVTPEIRQACPNVSIPEGTDLSELGYSVLVETAQPAPQAGYYVAEGAPADNTQTWVQVPVPTLPLAQNISALITRIRAETNRIVGDTVGALSNEYAQAKTDADAFKAAGYIGSVPSSVASWAAAKSWTPTQACNDILLAAANWIGAQAAIRSNRLARAEAAKVCTTQAQLDVVAAQWDGFVAAIRTQLGV